MWEGHHACVCVWKQCQYAQAGCVCGLSILLLPSGLHASFPGPNKFALQALRLQPFL